MKRTTKKKAVVKDPGPKPKPKKNQKALDSIAAAEKKAPFNTLSLEQKKARVHAKAKADPERYKKRDSASKAAHNSISKVMNRRFNREEYLKTLRDKLNKRGHGGPKSSF